MTQPFLIPVEPISTPMTPEQEIEFFKLVAWLKALIESDFRGTVTIHTKEAGGFDRNNIQVGSKILLDNIEI